MPFSCIKTTQTGQFETLRVQGQPVTELWEDIQSVLKTYAQLFPNAQHLFLAQPFGNASSNTTDWYGPKCSPIPVAEQDKAKQNYTETRQNILQWAKKNGGHTIDQEIAALLPTALTIPDVENIYHSNQGLILTAWGHRIISGMLGKGDLKNKETGQDYPQPKQGASVNNFPDASPSNEKHHNNDQQNQKTSQDSKNTHTSSQKRSSLHKKNFILWPSVWNDRWYRLFPAWHWFPVLTFGLPLLLLLFAIGTPLGAIFWGFGAIWAVLASLLIGFGLWVRQRWGWVFIIAGILLLLWLLYSLLTGLLSVRHFPSLPGFENMEKSYPASGAICLNNTKPQFSQNTHASPITTPAQLDSSHHRRAINVLQTAHNRGGNKGTLEIALSWDDPSDLDLHVLPPQGKEIGFSSRTSAGGTLDVDANVGTPTSPIIEHPIEHITWPNRPQPGTYRIQVIPYRIRSDNKAVPYHVTVYENGQPTQEYSSAARSMADRQQFNFNLPDTPPAPTLPPSNTSPNAQSIAHPTSDMGTAASTHSPPH